MDLDELLDDITPSSGPVRVYYRVLRWRPRDLCRAVRWGVQRWRRGYSDRDVWNFDHYLARIIPAAMRQLSHELHGVPGFIAERHSGQMEPATAEWRDILERVADGFEAWMTLSEEYPDGPRRADLERRWADGAGLLIENFGAFWD